MAAEIFENLCYMVWDVYRSPELRALSPSTVQPSTIQYLSFVLSIITCIIGFAANLLVIFVTGFLMKKNKYKLWFLNLALADFTFLLFLPFTAVSVIRGRWPYGSSMCKFHNFLSFVNMYAGIYILTALNIDRALSVTKPIWHQRFRSQKCCCFICALIWVSSAICSTPAIIYSDVHAMDQCTLSNYDISHFAQIFSDAFEEHYEDDSEENELFKLVPREICKNFSDLFLYSNGSQLQTEWKEATITTMRLVLTLAVVGYVIPLCVIATSNIIIAFHVKGSMMAASSKLYRLVLVGIMSFFCTRTPYVLSFIAVSVSICTMNFTLSYKLSVVLPLFFCVAATNSFLNPVVYVLVVNQARTEIVNFFRKKKKRFSSTF
ncbi:C3a anaphylatoxin chemotactic receptor-like [Anomaloglossus baeobatrachus]|uniref:C3a anaphylatoxin chemotactic receptor-like n=1 Tax=Anomaloglossus baeobatrachus TaxID=238106 RepID=UPI003F4FCF0F